MTISKSKIPEYPLNTDEIVRPLNRGLYHDGNGLYLKVSETGTKSWILRYMIAGTARNMGLGAFPKVGLAEARDRRKHADRMIWEGKDPIAVKKHLMAHDQLVHDDACAPPQKVRPISCGLVYVMCSSGRDNFCKIGVTGNLDRRLKAMRAANPHLKVFGFLDVGNMRRARIVEAEAHACLSYAAHGREWFRVDPELALATIRRVAA